MKNFRRGMGKYLIRLVGVAIALGGLFTLPVSAQAALPNLFSAPDGDVVQMDLAADYSGEVIRARWTDVDFGMVAQMARSGARVDGDSQPDFALNLFPDVTFPAYVQGIEEMFNGAVEIYGRVGQGAVSEFVLVVNSGVMHGYVQSGFETYEVRYQNGGHLIVEVDSSRYPDSLPPVPAPETDAGAAIQADPIPQADSGATIDVLGLYTPRAKNALGGVAAVEARILASIGSTNLGYANSGVTQRVNLVGMEEINYDEIIPGKSDTAMWSYALYRLAFGYYAGGGDPPYANYLADARDFRDAYGADLVFMVTDLPYAACGIGFLGGDPGDATVGYSVVHRYCTGATVYTVQHEMGHNMGACHDRANTDENTKLYYCYGDYSFGYWLQGGDYYTVMAYACSTCIARINYWSNPNVSYVGTPTGVGVGFENSAYNALTLNNTAYNVANYRQESRIQGSFTPAGTYDSLQYPRTYLDVEASSLDGSIVQVTYKAYYNGSWHTLTTDTTPGNGWRYLWNTSALFGKAVSVRAIAKDSAGHEGVISLNNVPVQIGFATAGGYSARVGERGVLDQPPVDLPDISASLFLQPIPVDEGDVILTIWQQPAVPASQGEMLPIRMY